MSYEIFTMAATLGIHYMAKSHSLPATEVPEPPMSLPQHMWKGLM
jgi:hypothetical protein